MKTCDCFKLTELITGVGGEVIGHRCTQCRASWPTPERAALFARPPIPTGRHTSTERRARCEHDWRDVVNAAGAVIGAHCGHCGASRPVTR